MCVAGEHLVAQGKAVKGHDKGNADLLAVGAMIARIAALCLWVPFRLTLKVGACNVVEQHLVLDCEQLSATLRQMRLKGSFVRKQMIQASIEAVFIDRFLAKLQQIDKRCAAVPVLGDVQLARWLAEPCQHKDSCHLRPCDALFSNRKKLLAELLKARPAPQRERKVHIAKLTRTLDADTFEPYRNGQTLAAIPEELLLLGTANQNQGDRKRT